MRHFANISSVNMADVSFTFKAPKIEYDFLVSTIENNRKCTAMDYIPDPDFGYDYRLLHWNTFLVLILAMITTMHYIPDADFGYDYYNALHS